MKIVHLTTEIRSMFGVLDDDGNVTPQEPIVASVPKFSLEAFSEAHRLISEKRDEATAESD